MPSPACQFAGCSDQTAAATAALVQASLVPALNFDVRPCPGDLLNCFTRLSFSVNLHLRVMHAHSRSHSPQLRWGGPLLWPALCLACAGSVDDSAVHMRDTGTRCACAPTCPAGPDDLNWAALWATWRHKLARRYAVMPFLVVVMIFPIGVLTGVLTNLSAAVCGGTPGALGGGGGGVAGSFEGRAVGRMQVPCMAPGLQCVANAAACCLVHGTRRAALGGAFRCAPPRRTHMQLPDVPCRCARAPQHLASTRLRLPCRNQLAVLAVVLRSDLVRGASAEGPAAG